MPLDATRLATALHSALVGSFGPAVNDTKLQAVCTDIASAIVTEITGHAVVSTTVLPGSFTNGAGAVTGAGTCTNGTVS